MPTFAQAQDTEREAFTATGLPHMTAAPSLPVQPHLVDNLLDPAPGTLTTTTANKTPITVEEFPAQENGASSAGFDWFEAFHVIPRSFDFGNLLSPQSTPIEVFNAFRRTAKEWTSFVNNAGAGTTLGGLPTLPTTIDALYGLPMTVDVDTAGDPFVDATLDFGFTGLGTIFVPIEIQRIVLWGAIPESEYVETLEFLTNVYESKDGTEKRESVRWAPRQAWNYTYLIDEGIDMQTLENLLFDFHQRSFGVPIWFEETEATVAIAVSDTVITVGATAYRDFREGGQAIIFTDQGTFDVLTIDAGGITSTTLTFTSPTLNAYAVGTRVYPLATCQTTKSVGGARWQDNLQRARIAFRATNNQIDIGDLSAFGSFNSKLLLDNGNSMKGSTIGHAFQMSITELDGRTGERRQDSPWDRHKRAHTFTLRAEGRQAVWEMRQMIHAIKGRFTSFYVPRSSSDLVVVADLLNASNTMDVTNVGYSQFVRNRQPKNVIRITFVDGSTPILRTITGSSVVSSTVEQLVVDSNWSPTITVAEIARVEYVEKVRFNTDKISIRYDRAGSRARLTAPVKAVFE